PQQAFERNFSTNLCGVLAISRAFAPVIERNHGGAIVNILTLVALASMPGLGVYNASKAAAWSLTQSLRAGLANRAIGVYGVFPGAVDTDMLAGVEMPKTSPADVATAIVAAISNDVEDIFPDPMSRSLYEAWRKDHKAVEKQFATMERAAGRAREPVLFSPSPRPTPDGLLSGTCPKAYHLDYGHFGGPQCPSKLT